MQTQKFLLSLRIQWFKLNAKNFLQRYQNGLLLFAFLLPGVAVGENFYLLFKGLTSPFIQISDSQTPFLNKLLWLLVLQLIFITFCRAQKIAITGGNFASYMHSLPLKEFNKSKLNIVLMLAANHFLWIIILASFYFQFQAFDSVNYLSLFNNVLLVLLLFTAQYVSLFKLNSKFISVLILINLLFISNDTGSFVWGWFLFVFVFWFVFALQLLNSDRIKIKNKTNMSFQLYGLKNNLYYQILFKATTTSTFFRLIIIVMLMVGFTLISGNLTDNNSGELFPYSMALEALLAYYFSGFFVCFDDQRQSMKNLLITLPVTKTFWFWRDFLTVILLSSFAHLLLYVLLMPVYHANDLVNLMSYFVILLLICYPMRLFVKTHQTSLTFMVLIIITAITLFNIS